MKTRIIIAASMMVCGATLAQAAPQDNIPGNQLISYQPQADRLALRLAAVIQGAENSASRMSSAAREAAIQSALQDAVMASGDYPRVVLSALEAFALCKRVCASALQAMKSSLVPQANPFTISL